MKALVIAVQKNKPFTDKRTGEVVESSTATLKLEDGSIVRLGTKKNLVEGDFVELTITGTYDLKPKVKIA